MEVLPERKSFRNEDFFLDKTIRSRLTRKKIASNTKSPIIRVPEGTLVKLRNLVQPEVFALEKRKVG